MQFIVETKGGRHYFVAWSFAGTTALFAQHIDPKYIERIIRERDGKVVRFERF